MIGHAPTSDFQNGGKGQLLSKAPSSLEGCGHDKQVVCRFSPISKREISMLAVAGNVVNAQGKIKFRRGLGIRRLDVLNGENEIDLKLIVETNRVAA